ncbi:hypothetical protein GCK72_004831 [Caenorhabditis remanei]|uniref:Uncharacterized protein n=1 Tax=Caenorhabditis remanei TaxID=31234 RepID=A0A6A5HAM6_CAERE|nr:hypothetical protein GCK72_004831 [Caenorhabditis remanei]KAF1764880.1 hypothetical protein GCK72_004831 [Caenorhabditis remanei]
MQILLFILFLPNFIYCKPNGNRDCMHLEDTFEYTDTKNVRQKFVGGCCTPECLALLGTTDSLTWSKTSSIDTFISTLYKEECCNDAPSAIATNETSTPTTVTSSISNTPSLLALLILPLQSLPPLPVPVMVSDHAKSVKYTILLI